MPLYTDPGYSYYGGSGSYSPYYGTPSYGSSSSSSSVYAPYSSTYNRAYSGTYVLPTPSRSTQYSNLVSRYQPQLSTITESPLSSRGTFIPLTRIQSPKVSTYTPTLSSTYISSRTSRPRTINTADIDVSASSRLGRHHHMEERKTEDEKEESTEELQSNNTDSDTNSSGVDPNSPYMPRIDGTDVGHHARSTIKRDRTVIRLSIMRPRNKGEPKVEVPTVKVDQEPDPIPQPELSTEKKDILERLYIQNEAKEEGLKISVTDMAQSQIGESSLNEVIIEVDPVTHTVRRLSIPQVPSFHDICEDISSDKIDDDLNAGVLRRRASLIQEQEIEILNELQKSQSGSIQVIHLERNVHQEEPRKSRKSKKTKKVRHKITANVEIENSPLTPVIKPLIDEDSTSSVNIATPKFTFNIEDIEEHKVFKLPKKRVKSVKSKKSEETSVEIKLDKVPEKESKCVISNKPEETTLDVNLRKPPEMVEKEFVKSDESQQQPEEEATPKSIRRIQKSESGEDFWSQIETRESLYMNHRKKFLGKNQTSTETETEAPPPTPTTPLTPSTPDVLDKQSTVLSKTLSLTEISKKENSLPPTSPKKPSAQPLKKDDQTKVPPKKTATKSQDSPKSKNLPKVLAKKKSSPKIDAKEEAALLESNLNSNSNTNSKPKAKPSASSVTTSITTNDDENITFLKINSGSGAKSPEKNKIVKSDTVANKTTVLKTAPAQIVQKAVDNKCDQIPEIFTNAAAIAQLSNEETTSKQELQKPLAPLAITETTVDAVGTVKTGTTGSDKLQLCDRKKTTHSILPIKIDDGTSSLFEVSSPMASPTSSTTTTPATLTTTPSIESVTSPPATDASAAQVSTQITTTTTTATTTKNSETATDATVSSSPCKSDRGVLGSGSNNLSKFATVSNLAQYLLDVDAELADYIPSSAEESDSSSGSYSGDGSLSASMKKKNKQLKKKAKEEQQAFDPNKKIKIDTKKKCYVKEEAPRYPLIATPRPLCKREKITYEESSNSSSEETDSESECTTSDEYEDELSPKDAIIRMSTCSNDSGFDGGTAPSSSKRALDCDVNCHKKCEKLTANLCGVNQKLIVEALACVKRGTHEARDSPCSPLSLNPAYKIEANDDETSYTYSQFQKSGRITAPATSIPRFKKYSVEDFHFLAVLGKGSFGKVLLAELRNTDFYYAVKCLKKDVVLEDDDVECTLIERKVLALGTKHPYLCHLFCTFQTESHLFFVMEYLNGGDLMFHIQESGRFPEDRARFYGAEIISGLKFLHKKGIIYRDLKLDNVLLDFDGHVRIADFGMCKLQIYLDKTADSFCGTPDYMAPEIIKGDKYNQNVDWWSFGVLLYEMLIGQSPFSGCDEDELFWSICNEIPWFPVYITKEATSILKGLLEKDYTKRVGSQYSPAGDICDHIFFKDIDWSLLEKRQLAPPFKPQVKHPLDTQYFDRAFTRERVRLTPIDKEILQSMDQEQFQGFSYTNPNATLD